MENNIVVGKACSRCGKIKGADLFPANANECKECIREKSKIHYHANLNKLKTKNRILIRFCKKCNVDITGKRGQHCKPCQVINKIEYQAKWKQENPEYLNSWRKTHKKKERSPDIKSKICPRCKINKDIIEFSKSRCECRACCKIITASNKEKRKPYFDEYRRLNKDKEAAYKKQYYKENIEYIRERGKRWREKNREKIHLAAKTYRKNNKEKRSKYEKEYWIKNKDKIYKRQNKRRRDLLKTDPSYKLITKLRTSLFNSIKSESKFSSAITLLGCSIEYFKYYVKRQWKIGMSWENWGRGKDKWHLDHILPIELFNMDDLNQQKVCFHYTNFCPIWESSNLNKSDYLDDGQQARYMKEEEKLDYLKTKGFYFDGSKIITTKIHLNFKIPSFADFLNSRVITDII